MEPTTTTSSGLVFGAGKAGAPFDPILFAKKPIVIVRAVCLLFSIIVFGCISSEGWRYSKDLSRETCVYNDSDFACNYGVGVGVIAFLAAIAFLAGEYLFEQMSSVKTRRHYVVGDLVFSGFWSFLFFIAFCTLTSSWSSTDADLLPPGTSTSNVKAAIVFCFFSTGTWGVCAYFAWVRWRMGVGGEFGAGAGGEGYMSYEGGGGGGADGGGGGGFGFSGGTSGGSYQLPFGGQQQQSKGPTLDFTTPNY